jgi:alkylation response protein AidB-like acyl-CoA dehydrogenase
VLAYASETADPVAVTAARALAGRTSHLVGRAAQQVTGAMGFSAEFPLHRYVRRAHSFDLMLGPWQVHTRNLGQLALSLPAVPRLGEA